MEFEKFDCNQDPRELCRQCKFGVSSNGQEFILTFDEEEFKKLSHEEQKLTIITAESYLVMSNEFSGCLDDTYSMQLNLILELTQKYNLY